MAMFLRYLCIFALLPLLCEGAAFNQSKPNGPANDPATRQLIDNINSLRHGHSNHETELRQIDEKFQNFEAILDNLRRQINESSKGHKEQLGNSTTSLAVKIGDLESALRSVISDLQQLKNHANDTSKALADLQKQVVETEKLTEEQSRYIEYQQKAMKSLTDLLQGTEESTTNARVYKVKAGDSLGEIAQANGTSIEVIKKLNNLSNDRIFINQKLKLGSGHE